MQARVLSALISLFLVCAVASAQVSGSVFVLDRFAHHIDGNSFDRLDAVYMSAGRGVTCSGAGLADGDYYFQITDPAGTLLLTPDPITERAVRIVGGQLAQYLGSKRLASNRGPCGSLFLRLYPFLATPLPGGEYKVWLTRVQDYDPLLTSLFGFDPARSESDNFRVNALVPQSILRGHKFFDHDRSGTWNPLVDPLEIAIGGWRVELWKNGVLDGVTFTDRDGWYTFIRNRDASVYEVREIAPGGFVNDATPGATWLATTARSGSASTTQEYVAGPEFGNVNFELSVAAGRSVTFWTSLDLCPGEGLALVYESDPAWRFALNTRNAMPVNLRNPVTSNDPNVSVFDVKLPPYAFDIQYQLWRFFVHRPDNDHAGYLLSRQVAATLLSTRIGFMRGDIYIDRFQDGVLVSLDEMLDGVMVLLSDPHAGDTGPNTIYQDLRHMMQMCTNEFGRINETGEPSAPQVVYRPTEIPPRIASPYLQ